MERKKIYKIIDQERDYQDFKWDLRKGIDGVPDSDKSIAEWVCYMETHINQVKREIYNLDKERALHQMRMVAALAVRCLEVHGCPKRDNFDYLHENKKFKKGDRISILKIELASANDNKLILSSIIDGYREITLTINDNETITYELVPDFVDLCEGGNAKRIEENMIEFIKDVEI